MDPKRPRHSVLSLFDPLAGSLYSSDDKENNAGDSSFFFPPGFRKTHQPFVQPTFKRRLIDVGDMTIDEPDMHELLADEEELEELDLNIADDNDNDTLTFRDMAKAATPKWSGRHFTKLTTPKSTVSSPKAVQTPPRTPLAEICFTDEATPMARKKSHRRVASSLARADNAQCHPSTPPPLSILPKFADKCTESSSQTPRSPPLINVFLDESSTQNATGSPPEALGSSVCTLNLPVPSGALIADTSIPLSTSPSSPRSSFGPSLSPSDIQPRLRPNQISKDNMSQLSVDLQSSFQMHMSSSDSSFDLLNEKMSFFDIKNGADSFMNISAIDNSFGDDDFAPAPSIPGFSRESRHHGTFSPPQLGGNHSPGLRNAVELQHSSPSSPSILSPTIEQPFKSKEKNQSRINHARTFSSTSVDSGTTEVPDSVELIPANSTKETSPVSTPGSLAYPVPIPALKIVKRSQVLTRPIAITSSRRISNISTAHSTNSRSNAPSSPMATSFTADKQSGVSHPGSRRAVPTQSHTNGPVLGGDGPRRVLISEGPKLTSNASSRATAHLEQAKASSATNGPRRVIVGALPTEKGPNLVAKPPAQTISGLKQPVKYATIGPTTAIPKPITRAAGSKLPAPASRIGGAIGMNKGIPARRLI